MKQLKLLFAFFLMLASQHTIAQLPAIDSMKIIPENPAENNEIKVIIYATFPSGECLLTNHSLDIQGSDVVLNLYYTVGAATYICHSTDTVSIRMLTAGDYELLTNLNMGPGQSFDTDTLLFSVESSLGVTEISYEPEIIVSPNPFQDKLVVTTNELMEKIAIFSVTGQKAVVEIHLIDEQEIIDLSDLKDGIYFIVLTDSQDRSYLKRIIKSAGI